MCKTFFASGSGLQCIWVAALGKKGLREQEEEATALRAETKKCEDAAASWRVARKALTSAGLLSTVLLSASCSTLSRLELARKVFTSSSVMPIVGI